MAKTKEDYPKSNPLAQMSISFFITWLVSFIVVGLAHSFFKENIVLGTVNLTGFAAQALSSAAIAWITVLAMPIFTEIELRKKMVLTPAHWMIGYLIINLFAVFFVTRLAYVFGLGVSSWMYIVGLAIVLDFLQGMVMMGYGEAIKSVKR